MIRAIGGIINPGPPEMRHKFLRQENVVEALRRCRAIAGKGDALVGLQAAERQCI